MRGWLLLIGLAACSSDVRLDVPVQDGERAMLVLYRVDGVPAALYGLSLDAGRAASPAVLSVASDRHADVLVALYDRPLSALGLIEGAIPLVLDGVALPAWRRALAGGLEVAWSDADPAPLAALRVPRNLACGGCSGGTERCVDGRCVDPCAGVGCGLVDGLDCGICGAGAGCFEGQCLPGLRAWLRADRGISERSSGEVSGWEDQSGHGYRLISGIDHGPRVVEGAIAGHPALRFGSLRKLSITDVLGVERAAGRAFLAVARLEDLGARSPIIVQGVAAHDSHQVGIDANTWQTAGRRFGVYLHGSFDSAVRTSTAPRIHSLVIPSFAPGTRVTTTVRYRIDGAAAPLSPTDAFDAVQDAEHTSTAICGFPGFADACSMLLAEVLVLSPPDEDALRHVEAALSARYAIPLR